MMNKPFKGILVPNVAPTRPQYKNGKYPEVGDLVSKEVAKNPDLFRKVTGVVVSTTSAFEMWPNVQWSEFETKTVAVNPNRMELVSRG